MMAESGGGVFAQNVQQQMSAGNSAATSADNNDVNRASPPLPGAANSNVSASRSFPNNSDLTQVAAKIESLKKWTVSTYKTTKHSINEHLGKVQKTVDKDLEERIEALRELERRYQEVLTTARSFTGHFEQANKMQRCMAEAMYQLSCKEDILNNEFAMHSDALRGVSQTGELFFHALNTFISALETVADKTIQDTFLTIDHHDQARLEYDVYRHEIETLRLNPNSHTSLDELERQCNASKAKYEQLKEDVRVKLTLLEENRCKVMRRQIATIQRALIVYHTGSASAVQEVVDRLNPKGGADSSLHEADPMCPNRPTGGHGGGAVAGRSFLEQ